MEDDPISLSADLARNIGVFRDRFGASGNADIIIRRFRSGAFISALMTIDGMTDTREIDENILKPCMALPPDAGEDAPAESRVDYLIENVVSVLPTEMKSNFDDLIADALSGQSVLLCDGCAVACVMDTRGFEKRAVGRPEAEQVVLGPHESFGESIRTNITLLRRIVQREELTTEFLSIGGAMKTRCALLYLRGTADEAMLARIRKRLTACSSDFALSAGEVEQLIEDHPMALIPQCVSTERPDRAASFLAEGQVVVLTDGSPLALGALELSAGCAALQACTLAPVWKLCIASFLLSFGGLSILAQSRAAAADAGLEGRQLPGCKMLQGAIAAALTLLLAPLAQAGRWCAPTLGASTMMETAGPVMLLLSSVLLLYFRKKYHSILREGRV